MYNPAKPYEKQILKLIRQTWQTPYLAVIPATYPVIKKKFSYFEIDHTDGIGSKGYYHWQKRTFKSAVLDALAMNLNDLAVMGAVPYKLQNHIIVPEDDSRAIFEIVKNLVAECRKRKIAITGGETSIQNNLEGLDISITISGFIAKLRPNKFQIGDVLIGLPSNGLHANGFTRVRELFSKSFRWEFVAPTVIYSDLLLSLVNLYNIHGMAHITGGAYTKLKGMLEGVNAILFRDHKLQPQAIFRQIYKKGVKDYQMYQTFNCGIGFILAVPEEEAGKILRRLNGDVIGKITPGQGIVKIESAFSNRQVEL